MILKIQIDASYLTSAIAQEVLNVIKPFLLLKEEGADSEKRRVAPETGIRAENKSFPQVGLREYGRFWEIREKGIPSIIPVSKSTWVGWSKIRKVSATDEVVSSMHMLVC